MLCMLLLPAAAAHAHGEMIQMMSVSACDDTARFSSFSCVGQWVICKKGCCSTNRRRKVSRND